MANPHPTPRKPASERPFKTALQMEIAAAGDNFKALRRVAAALVSKASDGDVQAIKELADRLDGKVPQGIGQADDLGPVTVRWEGE